MKKFASFVLILALSAFSISAITGCGGDEKDKAKDKDAAKDKDKDKDKDK